MEIAIEFQMEAHKPYKVTLRTHSRDISSPEGEISPHSAKLCFMEEHNDRVAIAEAVTVAARSDVSIIFGGRTREHESEGFDLQILKLPESQVRMIKAVASVSKKTIFVMHCGNPVDVSDFVTDVDGVVAAHFPGQEGAQAIVNIIGGKTNPSGKLATTWPMRLDESSVPSFGNFPAQDYGNGPVIKYREGLQMGYRSSNTASSVRWPFGYGLSYSNFEYKNLAITVYDSMDGAVPLKRSSSEALVIAVDIQNTSDRAGYEIVQVYSQPPPHPMIWRPQSELIAFTKAWLEPKEIRRIGLSVSRRDISGYWDSAAKCWRSLKGSYKITSGECAAYLQIKDVGSWNGL